MASQFNVTKINLSLGINDAIFPFSLWSTFFLNSVIQNHDVFQDEEEVPPEAGKDQEETVEKTAEAAKEQSETEEKSQGEKSKESQTEDKKSDEGSEKEEPQVRKHDFICFFFSTYSAFLC